MTGRQNGEFRGSKFQAGRDVKDIAKAVRSDIKAAIKAGTLPAMKTSVTIDRFSGGCSLSVKVKEIAGGALNPDYVREQAADPMKNHFELPDRYLPECAAALETLKGIVTAYKRDNSDSMVDYFDVNFYDSVDVSWKLRQSEREAILSEPTAHVDAYREHAETIARCQAAADETLAELTDEDLARVEAVVASETDDDTDGDDDPDGGPSGSPAPDSDDEPADEGSEPSVWTQARSDADVRNAIGLALAGAAASSDYQAAAEKAAAVEGATPELCRSVADVLRETGDKLEDVAARERWRRQAMAADRAAGLLVARIVNAPAKVVPLRPELGDDGGLLGTSLRSARDTAAAVAPQTAQDVRDVPAATEDTPPAPVGLDRSRAAQRFDAILVAGVRALVEARSEAAAAAVLELVVAGVTAAAETLAGAGGAVSVREEVDAALARTDLEAHGWAAAKALRSYLIDADL